MRSWQPALANGTNTGDSIRRRRKHPGVRNGERGRGQWVKNGMKRRSFRFLSGTVAGLNKQ